MVNVSALVGVISFDSMVISSISEVYLILRGVTVGGKESMLGVKSSSRALGTTDSLSALGVQD